jgi:hypothetical protein
MAEAATIMRFLTLYVLSLAANGDVNPEDGAVPGHYET